MGVLPGFEEEEELILCPLPKGCGRMLPVSKFRTWGQGKNKNCLRPTCKDCEKRYNKELTELNRKHGDSKPDVCQINGCSGNAPGQRIAIDHDHETGEVRGFPCVRCNSGIAALGDNVEGVLNAAAYLVRAGEMTLDEAVEYLRVVVTDPPYVKHIDTVI